VNDKVFYFLFFLRERGRPNENKRAAEQQQKNACPFGKVFPFCPMKHQSKFLCELWVLFVENPIVFMVQIKRIKYAASHMRVTIYPEERRLQFPV
jgi:hypothetical protein